MDFQKKQWQFNDIITEGELNRMEDGIEEGITKAEQAEQTAQQAAQTATQTANDLDAHLAETTQNAHFAKNIGIEDTAGNFTATDVEGALSELFTSVSDGKDLIGGAITDVDPSIVIPPNPTFQQLAAAIGQISTGKKWAKGVYQDSVPGRDKRTVPIDNLGFTPNTVVVYGIHPTYASAVALKNVESGVTIDGWYQTNTRLLVIESVNTDGFVFSWTNDGSINVELIVQWEAYE